MEYWIGVATLTGIYIIAVLGVSVLHGFTGLFTMGHAGFMSIGAYTSAILTTNLGLPIPVGLLCAILTSAIIGSLIGMPTLKLKSDYFVIVTLGIGEAVRIIIQNLTSLTGGARGFQGIPAGSSFAQVWIILLVVVVLIANLKRCKFGRNCIAIREEPMAASSAGINVPRYKLLAMAISCGLCGLAGGLLAHYMHYLTPAMFNMQKSNELIMTVILGGTGSITGTILAGLVLIPLPEFLRFGSAQEWRMVIYGVLVVFVILFKPSGLMGTKELTPKNIKIFFNNVSKKLNVLSYSLAKKQKEEEQDGKTE